MQSLSIDLIDVPLKEQEDLCFKELQLKASGKKEPLCWRLDLGLERPFFPLEDRLVFEALSLGLKQFAQELYKEGNRQKAFLYLGSGDLRTHFLWTEKQCEEFSLWQKIRAPLEKEHAERLFCMDAFVSYFQLLAHSLPDSLEIAIEMDLSSCGTLAEKFHLASKERFEYFDLHLKGVEVDPLKQQAICLPKDSSLSEEVLNRLDQLFHQLNPPYRVLSEPLLAESWAGVDQIYVLDGTLGVLGERMLKGFEAAGGEVIRGRGI